VQLRRRKEVEVNVKTNETQCTNKVLTKFKDEMKNGIFSAHTVTDATCEMVDDKPEYSVKAEVNLPNDQVQDVAKQGSEYLAGRSFPKRRLLDQDVLAGVEEQDRLLGVLARLWPCLGEAGRRRPIFRAVDP